MTVLLDAGTRDVDVARETFRTESVDGAERRVVVDLDLDVGVDLGVVGLQNDRGVVLVASFVKKLPAAVNKKQLNFCTKLCDEE